MSYYVMKANVTIGDVIFDAINSFTIKESVDQVSDDAEVILARNYQELEHKPVLDYIKVGMPVNIRCGYDADMQTEFTGFVKTAPDVNYPIKITCDELFPFRQNNWKKSWRSVTLIEYLTTIAPGYTIECPVVQLGKQTLANASTYQALTDLKKKWGFFSRIYDKTLHVGFAFDYSPSFTQNHIYTIGQNVRDFSGLKYSTDTDFNVQVNVRVHLPNGKKLEIKAGSKDKDAKVMILDRYNIHKTEAEKIAKAQLTKVLYSGYTGNIDGFGTPRTHAGDSLTIKDEMHPEREGTYLIEKVNISFKDAEIRRENFLSYKL